MTARVRDEEADRVDAILASYKPIDPLLRDDEYRKEGWTSFDPKAEPYLPGEAGINRMRANWPG